MEHKKFEKAHVINLEMHLLSLEPKSVEYYIDEIRHSPKTGHYYVLMREDSNRRVMEFHLNLDWAASTAPSIASEVNLPFHVSEFPTLLYKDS